VEEFKPDIIALELDAQRALALSQKEQTSRISLAQIRQIGVKGYLFAKIGQYAQQKLGHSVGVAPGSEMKTAMDLAAKQKTTIAFIDQPIQITLRNFSKRLTWKEKFRFLGDIFNGIFRSKKQAEKWGIVTFDLRAVPDADVIELLIEQLRKRYPSVYKTLIDDRNRYMVKQLVKLIRKDPEKKILAVVGAGHVKGMNEILLKVDVL